MRKSVLVTITSILLNAAFLLTGCKTGQDNFYTKDDFQKVRKTDIHFHYNTFNPHYLELADSLNFMLVSPNVDAGMPIDEQLEIAAALKRAHPDKFAFLGTFSVNNFGSRNFAGEVNTCIDQCLKAGASGIKIWKNIGMVLKDSTGSYIMTDHPAFEPIFRRMDTDHIPVMAHLGEPKNCWLPVNEMTLGNDRGYYKSHPQYHMYLHPEAPSYNAQLEARDNLLEKYPSMKVVGAHLGSMEWNVDEIARRLERFPNFDVEISGRIGHLQYQALNEREKVRSFMIKYQDRIMYGTDVTLNETDGQFTISTDELRELWYDQWLFLATDSVISVNDLDGQKVKGLQLPRKVIDKIYQKNAERFLKINRN